MLRIAIFVSGSGTNCENLIHHYSQRADVEVALVVSNRSDAYALTRANNNKVLTCVHTREDFRDETRTLDLLRQHGIDFIVLAGFLLLVPEYLVKAYPRRIVNLHPALLPAYGGKGMYGHHVHEAVHAAREPRTGITVHYVDAEFDHGDIIAQYAVDLLPTDTVEDIEAKIHTLEQTYFPEAVDKAISAL